MGEKLNLWLEKPLFVYLFGLFFLVYKSSQYFQSFQFHIFILFVFIYFTSTGLGLFFLNKTLLSKYRYIILIEGWFFFLYTNDIRILNQLYIALIIILALVIVIIKSIASKKLIFLSNKLLNFFFISITFFVLLNGVKTYNNELRHFEIMQNEKTNLPITKYKHDIIWILLDEYAAPSTLRTQFHFKDWLVDSLEKRKFFVFDSLPSRYDGTILSLNSLFNLDDTITPSSNMYAAKYLNKSRWIQYLKVDGYTFNSFDFLTISGSIGISNVSLYFFQNKYSLQILNNSFFFSAWYYLIEPKEKIIDGYNKIVAEKSLALLKSKKNAPQFTWIHLLIPHSPFYKDENGNINNNPVINPNRSTHAEANKQYINYLSYGNKIALNLLTQIPDWENKTIIISGDHGARMFLQNGDTRRFVTFAAIYFPKMDSTELKQIKYLQQIPLHIH